MGIKTAIVLAGGMGTRLASAMPDVPKCMAEVAGKPFINYVIEHLQGQGIGQFIFALGYKSDAVVGFLPGALSEDNYTLSVEPEPLGTGGAIKLACKQTTEKTVLVVNGDTLFKIDLSKLAAFHHMCGAHCTIALKPMQQFTRYGAVELNKDYSIRNFTEKGFHETGYINGGAYLLHAEKFLQENLPDKFSFETDYLQKFYSQRRFYGLIQDKYFIDIGTPEDYLRAQQELPTNNDQ